jgi:hypothetical protein
MRGAPEYTQFAEITTDVYDIATRIREGDESGWRGDPSASLMHNPFTNKFEVWMVDGMNVPYIAATSDKCDHSLILKLIEGDWQKGRNLLEEIQKKNRKARQDQLDAEEDKRREIADKLHWAITKDVGHLEGGNRRHTSFYAKGK